MRMEFTRQGLPGQVTAALERVVRPGRAQVAVWPLRRPCWVCVVVDGPERYYDLDRHMKADLFGGLLEAGFKPLPGEMTRLTSIYRATSRAAVVGFNEDAGDRVLVLLCPRAEWPKLSLCWPSLFPTPK